VNVGWLVCLTHPLVFVSVPPAPSRPPHVSSSSSTTRRTGDLAARHPCSVGRRSMAEAVAAEVAAEVVAGGGRGAGRGGRVGGAVALWR